MREAVRDWSYDNPDRCRERSEKRRTTTFTQFERDLVTAQLIARDGGFCCFYCKTSLDQIAYHVDHKRPISWGGTHELDNFALACLQCNQEKYNKDLQAYRAWLHKNGEAVRF